jgi:hypothetical protein
VNNLDVKTQQWDVKEFVNKVGAYLTCSFKVNLGFGLNHRYPAVEARIALMFITFENLSKIFRTDALKITKLNIRPIGHHHPRSSSLPHVDTGSTVSSIFGTLPGSPFLAVSSTLAIRPGSPQWYQTGVLSTSISFLEIVRSHRVSNQRSAVGGGCFVRNAG